MKDEQAQGNPMDELKKVVEEMRADYDRLYWNKPAGRNQALAVERKLNKLKRWADRIEAALSRAPVEAAGGEAAVATIPAEATLELTQEMAYLLRLVPRGEDVPLQFHITLSKQYEAAVIAGSKS